MPKQKSKSAPTASKTVASKRVYRLSGPRKNTYCHFRVDSKRLCTWRDAAEKRGEPLSKFVTDVVDAWIVAAQATPSKRGKRALTSSTDAA